MLRKATVYLPENLLAPKDDNAARFSSTSIRDCTFLIILPASRSVGQTPSPVRPPVSFVLTSPQAVESSHPSHHQHYRAPHLCLTLFHPRPPSPCQVPAKGKGNLYGQPFG